MLANGAVSAVIAGPRTLAQWQDYAPALAYAVTPDDQALVDALVAPGLLSTITVWPRLWVSFSARARASTAVVPPAGNGTTRLIGLAGQACAKALPGASAIACTAVNASA